MNATLWAPADVVHMGMAVGATIVLCVWGICIAAVRYQAGSKAVSRGIMLERANEDLIGNVVHAKAERDQWKEKYDELKALHPDPPKNILPADAVPFDPERITPTM